MAPSRCHHDVRDVPALGPEQRVGKFQLNPGQTVTRAVVFHWQVPHPKLQAAGRVPLKASSRLRIRIPDTLWPGPSPSHGDWHRDWHLIVGR
jgi:hypothetical protein